MLYGASVDGVIELCRNFEVLEHPCRCMRKAGFTHKELLASPAQMQIGLTNGYAPRGVRDGWVDEGSVGMATAAAVTATPRCAGSMATSFLAPWSFPVCGCTAMPVTRDERPAVTSCALRTGCSRKPMPLHRIHICVTDVGAKLHPHPAPPHERIGGFASLSSCGAMLRKRHEPSESVLEGFAPQRLHKPHARLRGSGLSPGVTGRRRRSAAARRWSRDGQAGKASSCSGGLTWWAASSVLQAPSDSSSM